MSSDKVLGARSDTATRDALVKAGIEVMRAHPWERVSAKSIADAAGLDPALVTYHFGGRSGLVAAVATEAASLLQEQMAINYASISDVEVALQTAVADPISVIASEPFVIQLWVRELLLNGDDRTDIVLHDLAVPYLDQIRLVIDSAHARGSHVDDGDGILPFVLTATAQLRWFLTPWMRRTPDAPLVDLSLDEFAQYATDFVLHGVFEPADASLPRPVQNHDSKGGLRPTRREIVEAALQLMRQNRSHMTLETLAAMNGFNLEAVKAEFASDADLAIEVARSAVEMMSVTPARGRGRPSVRNPELERNLIRSAIELIELQGVAVPARAVAMRAGCDPALVTYYFGGRSGLFRSVASEIVASWVDVFLRASEGHEDPLAGLRAGLAALVRQIAEHPKMSHFLLDAMLVNGTSESDREMQRLLAPYVGTVLDTVAKEKAAGRTRHSDVWLTFLGVGVMPLFLAATMPILHRAFRDTHEQPDAEQTTAAILRLIFEGALSDDGS